MVFPNFGFSTLNLDVLSDFFLWFHLVLFVFEVFNHLDSASYSQQVVPEPRFTPPSKTWNMDELLGGMIKLTGSNYSIWRPKMKDMLVCKDMWLPVLHGPPAISTPNSPQHRCQTGSTTKVPHEPKLCCEGQRGN